MESGELAALLDQHAAALELFAAQWSATPADVVQEVFVLLIGRDQRPPQIKPWLFRAVKNRAINSLRSESRRRKHEMVKAQSSSPWFQPATDDALDAVEVQRALQDLPESEREVVIARIWGDLTFGEIASVIGSSTSSTHRLFEKGIRTLKERFNASCLTTDTRHPKS